MATKPTVGASDGTWGTALNAFLDVSLASNGKIDNAAELSSTDTPTEDAQVVCKKYVDDIFEVDGVSGDTFGSGSESVTFPNGMIMKMGEVDGDSDTSTPITFEDEFPNAAVCAFVNPGASAASYPLAAVNLSTAGFTVYSAAGSNNHNLLDPIYWLAIGY